MLLALNKDGERIEAKPNAKAICPNCNSEVIAKCGNIKIWHWSHKNLVECDNWSEGETEWHLRWKKLVKKENCEVKIGEHRADIINNNNIIIELQKSNITPDEIVEREIFYKDMIWLFDGSEFYEHFIINKKNNNCYGFRWKWYRQTHSFIRKRLFYDFGINGIFEVKEFYNDGKTGWGNFLHRALFIKIFFRGILDE